MTVVATRFSHHRPECDHETSWFARQRAERVRLIEEYLELGVSAERIADDFDVTPGALARQMHRCGRRDLAKPFQAQWRRRKREQRARATGTTAHVRAA